MPRPFLILSPIINRLRPIFLLINRKNKKISKSKHVQLHCIIYCLFYVNFPHSPHPLLHHIREIQLHNTMCLLYIYIIYEKLLHDLLTQKHLCTEILNFNGEKTTTMLHRMCKINLVKYLCFKSFNKETI